MGSWESRWQMKPWCRRDGPEQGRRVRRETENGRSPAMEGSPNRQCKANMKGETQLKGNRNDAGSRRKHPIKPSKKTINDQYPQSCTRWYCRCETRTGRYEKGMPATEKELSDKRDKRMESQGTVQLEKSHSQQKGKSKETSKSGWKSTPKDRCSRKRGERLWRGSERQRKTTGEGRAEGLQKWPTHWRRRCLGGRGCRARELAGQQCWWLVCCREAPP